MYHGIPARVMWDKFRTKGLHWLWQQLLESVSNQHLLYGPVTNFWVYTLNSLNI
jgi:hypothetical protein